MEAFYSGILVGRALGCANVGYRSDHSQAVSQSLRRSGVRKPVRPSGVTWMKFCPNQGCFAPSVEIRFWCLNQPRYHVPAYSWRQRILAAASSRSMRPWIGRIMGSGLLAPSYADIFYNNSFKKWGLLPLVLSEEDIERVVWQADSRNPRFELTA